MLKNKVQITFSELEGLFGKTLFLNVPLEKEFVGISSDSREIEDGNIFVALKGENIDGHDKVQEAFDKGAALCMVEKSWYKEHETELHEKPVLVVKSSLSALHTIANYHRKRFNIPVIAIGGSNGKTTTKELTAHLLSRKFKVLKTYENFNNQIGVPHMLFLIDSETEAAVLEMGTNEPGEIKILASLMEPTHGLITNIGKEHLEKLIDLDGVELEETLLFGELFKNNGTAFINLDDKRLKKYETILNNKVTFGHSKDADIKATISLDAEIKPVVKISYQDEKITARMKTTGLTTGLNAVCASAIALSFGLSSEELISGLESYETVVTHGYARMTLEKIGGVNLLNDCYNANPSSMKAALDTVEKIRTPGRKYIVLGDMRELGDASFVEHKKLLKNASLVADEVFIVGDEMRKAKKEVKHLQNVHLYKTKEDIIDKMLDTVKPRDFVLVKGSRGMRMEFIIDEYKAHINKYR